MYVHADLWTFFKETIEMEYSSLEFLGTLADLDNLEDFEIDALLKDNYRSFIENDVTDLCFDWEIHFIFEI